MQQGVRSRIRGLTQCSPHSGEEYNSGGNDTSSVPGAGERDVASVQPTLSLGAMPFGCERTQFHVQHLVDRMVKVSAARTLFYRFTRTPKDILQATPRQCLDAILIGRHLRAPNLNNGKPSCDSYMIALQLDKVSAPVRLPMKLVA
jgi:hypothetical protein